MDLKKFFFLNFGPIAVKDNLLPRFSKTDLIRNDNHRSQRPGVRGASKINYLIITDSKGQG